ncbi:MAG: Arginine exporter protein ArgO [Olavius algarvensis Delta 4 endosymbiont]|nr:MAG: Arginine exporter protein ArgO [Olavius algarvensis Delta 4 endosymbiont]
MLIQFAQGFGVGGGLIVAIGAQNAYVLSQAVRRNYILIIPFICIVCDAALIAVGVSGIGSVVASSPRLSSVATWGGAAFLFWYGFRAFRSALRGGHLEANKTAAPTLKAAVAATLAVTLLNPHVYLDTVILLGSVSGQYDQTGRVVFAAGAIAASILWFFSLSFGGRMLAPLFRQPLAWRILDGLVCTVMWTIAVSLVLKRPI